MHPRGYFTATTSAPGGEQSRLFYGLPHRGLWRRLLVWEPTTQQWGACPSDIRPIGAAPLDVHDVDPAARHALRMDMALRRGAIAITLAAPALTPLTFTTVSGSRYTLHFDTTVAHTPAGPTTVDTVGNAAGQHVLPPVDLRHLTAHGDSNVLPRAHYDQRLSNTMPSGHHVVVADVEDPAWGLGEGTCVKLCGRPVYGDDTLMALIMHMQMVPTTSTTRPVWMAADTHLTLQGWCLGQHDTPQHLRPLPYGAVAGTFGGESHHADVYVQPGITVPRQQRVQVLRARLHRSDQLERATQALIPRHRPRLYHPHSPRRRAELGAMLAELIREHRERGSTAYIDHALAATVAEAVNDGIATDHVVSLYNGIAYDCHEQTVEQCPCCDSYYPGHDGYEVRERGGRNSEYVCYSCYESDYVLCEDTGDYHPCGDAYWHDSSDAYYTYPEDDDCDDEDGDWHRLLRPYGEEALHHLDACPHTTSTRWGDFLMGVELEVEATDREYRSECIDATQRALVEAHPAHPAVHVSDYAIFTRDSSLDEACGFEIVTAPRSLKEHVLRFKKWQPHRQLRAWKGGRCGMHVHIDRKAFSDATLGKFIEFINAEGNSDLIHKIAGRHWRGNAHAESYCSGDDVVAGNPVATLKAKDSTRYRMVNTCNTATVELRIFRASLKKERLLAQIEFAHAAVMFCRQASMQHLTDRDFRHWLSVDGAGAGCMYRHLAEWLGVPVRGKKSARRATALHDDATEDV